MSDCANCGKDANHYCDYCEIALCDECATMHDHDVPLIKEIEDDK